MAAAAVAAASTTLAPAMTTTTLKSTPIGELSEISSWMIGVSLYLVGTTSLALGANLQRLSVRKEEQLGSNRPTTRQPLWVFGVLLYTSVGIFLTAALLFATQAQLSPLILFIFVGNTIL